MHAQTPVDRAVTTYCDEWPVAPIHGAGLADVNPETLNEATAPDFSFRYIDISSVNRGAIDWTSAPELRFADAPSRARRVVRSGDTMICTVRPLLGAHASISAQMDGTVVCSTGFAVVRPNRGLAPAFLRHLPFAEQITRQLIAWQCGTNYPAVNERDVRRLLVPVPPPDEQAAIARILDAVGTAIERARASAARARVLHDSLLRDLMQKGIRPAPTTRGSRPVTWNLHRVDEVADVESGVTLGKDVSGFKSVELPYLRVANVQDGHVDLSTIKMVRVRIVDVDKYRLEAGDVLMTEGGDIDKLGRGTLWEGQIPNCLHQNHVFRIRTNRKLLDPAFYALVVESDIAKRYFTRVAKRTTNLASTNKTQVRAFRFPVPPTLREQEEIVGVMKAAKATVAGFVEKQGVLSNLKTSLMADLLSGRVRVRTTTEEVTA